MAGEERRSAGLEKEKGIEREEDLGFLFFSNSFSNF
jgi:hypothetical protein